MDDYNNDTEDGLHITSMAGTWMSVVEGFAGMRVRNDKLIFNPFLPQKWKSFSFTVGFRGANIKLSISKEEIHIVNLAQKGLSLQINDKEYELGAAEELKISNAVLA